jgi:hypothetical protein
MRPGEHAARAIGGIAVMASARRMTTAFPPGAIDGPARWADRRFGCGLPCSDDADRHRRALGEDALPGPAHEWLHGGTKGAFAFLPPSRLPGAPTSPLSFRKRRAARLHESDRTEWFWTTGSVLAAVGHAEASASTPRARSAPATSPARKPPPCACGSAPRVEARSWRRAARRLGAASGARGVYLVCT